MSTPESPYPEELELGSQTDIDSPRRRRIERTRRFLVDLGTTKRFLGTRGEGDPEVTHHNRAYIEEVHRSMQSLDVSDQSLLEAAFPLDGSPRPNLEDRAERTQLASEHDIRPQDVVRRVDEALGRLEPHLYGQSAA